MHFSILGIAALVSCVLAAPAEMLKVRETAVEATDRLVFSSTISQFITARNKKYPATLDWTADGCSSSPDKPLGFDFVNSCYRHDFAYRNFKSQSRFTDANKLLIDGNFKSDLYNQCKSESFASICRGVADIYYEAVRAFGNTKAAGVLATAQIAAKDEIAAEIARREAENVKA